MISQFRSTIAVFATLALGALGCGTGSPSSLDEAGGRPLLVDLDSEVRGFPGSTEPGFTAASRPGGTIVVQGFQDVPSGGYDIVAQAWEDDSTIQLTASLARSSAGVAMPLRHVYEARIQEVPAGRYELRVVHEVHGSKEVVYRTSTEVN